MNHTKKRVRKILLDIVEDTVYSRAFDLDISLWSTSDNANAGGTSNFKVPISMTDGFIVF